MSIHFVETSQCKDTELSWEIINGELYSTLHYMFPSIDKNFQKKIDYSNFYKSVIEYYNKLSEEYVLIYYPIKICTGEASEFDEDNYPTSFDIDTEDLYVPEFEIKEILKYEFPNKDSDEILKTELGNVLEYFDNQYYGNSVTYEILLIEKAKYKN